LIIIQDIFVSMKHSFSPGVLSLLPIFYVGWKDSILSSSEMKHIHKMIEAMPHLTSEDVNYLIEHTNPDNPPGQAIYREWLDALRQHSNNLTSQERKDLVTMGMAMAKIIMNGENTEHHNATISCIKEVEMAMGISDPVIHHNLMTQLGIDHQSEYISTTTYGFDVEKLTIFYILSDLRQSIIHNRFLLIRYFLLTNLSSTKMI
jgi:hypothetical protein